MKVRKWTIAEKVTAGICTVLLGGALALYLTRTDNVAVTPLFPSTQTVPNLEFAESQANGKVFGNLNSGKPAQDCRSTLLDLENAYRAAGRNDDANRTHYLLINGACS
jgi:hypothetical protein